MFTKSKTAKVFAGIVGLAIALAFVVTPVTSKAATAEELTTQINLLLAQIAALQSQVGGGSSMSSSYAFSSDLTIGSTGAGVTALQDILISGGFLTMPSGVAKGYFGSLTASAVKAWQASVGLPSTGYVGPLSRAKLNSMGGGSMGGGSTGTYPAGCTSNTGFSSTTGMSCAGSTTFPAGCTSAVGFSTSTGMSCSGTPGTTMNGTDGSVTLSYVSYAPASQTLKKGDMNKPVISAKLQAVNGQVAVTRFDVHFSERPWLVIGKLTLTDSTGAVLATKVLSGASDATEVTVGTDYLVRFDNVNVPIMPGSDKILAVAVDVLAASDKITGQTVYVGIPSGSIRTINGKGYTDSIGLSSGQGSGVTSSTGNSVVLSSTGSTGTIYTRLDPSSSSVNRTVVTSSSQSTPGVVLGVFGIKAQNQSATINSMSFNINNSTGVATTTLYSNLRLSVGGLTYGSNALTAGNTTFTNMSIPLSVDAWVPVTLMADVNTNQTGLSASSTIVGASIVGVDSNYNTVTLTSATNQTSSDNVYTINGINVTPVSQGLTNCGSSYANGPTDNCAMNMSFKVDNAGSNSIYISKTPGIALSTSSSPAVSSTTLAAYFQVNPVAGDTTSSYIVPGNTYRNFSLSGRFGRPAGLIYESFNIAAIKFGTSTTDGTSDNGSQNTTAYTNTGSIVNYGLTTLQVSY